MNSLDELKKVLSGEWHKPVRGFGEADEKVICPECLALVHTRLKLGHYDWHITLEERIQKLEIK